MFHALRFSDESHFTNLALTICSVPSITTFPADITFLPSTKTYSILQLPWVFVVYLHFKPSIPSISAPILAFVPMAAAGRAVNVLFT